MAGGDTQTCRVCQQQEAERVQQHPTAPTSPPPRTHRVTHAHGEASCRQVGGSWKRPAPLAGVDMGTSPRDTLRTSSEVRPFLACDQAHTRGDADVLTRGPGGDRSAARLAATDCRQRRRTRQGLTAAVSTRWPAVGCEGPALWGQQGPRGRSAGPQSLRWGSLFQRGGAEVGQVGLSLWPASPPPLSAPTPAGHCRFLPPTRGRCGLGQGALVSRWQVFRPHLSAGVPRPRRAGARVREAGRGRQCGVALCGPLRADAPTRGAVSTVGGGAACPPDGPGSGPLASGAPCGRSSHPCCSCYSSGVRVSVPGPVRLCAGLSPSPAPPGPGTGRSSARVCAGNRARL